MGEALNKEKNSITDYLLDQEKLSSGQFPRDEIYEIEIEGSVIGPFWQEDLREFLHAAGLFETETLIRNLDTDKWTLIFEHPYFQRRRPSLVSTKEMNIEQESFYVLKDGQKLGPYTDAQLQKELDEHNILLNDFVSIDEGQSWAKLFELESFDRRKKGNQALPPLPEGHIFNNSLYDADRKLSLAQSTEQEKDALISLAYIGHLNEGKKKFHIDVSKAKEEVSQNTHSSDTSESSSSPNLIKIVGTLAIVGLVFGLYHMMSSTQAPQVDTSKLKKAKRVSTKEFKATKKAKAVRPKKVVPKRAPARARLKVNETNRQITKGSTSIKNAAFLQAKELDNGYREEVQLPPEVIFDDNSEAVELDPIRSRVSKDVIDPEFEEVYDEMESEDFDGFGPVDEQGNAYDDAQLID